MRKSTHQYLPVALIAVVALAVAAHALPFQNLEAIRQMMLRKACFAGESGATFGGVALNCTELAAPSEENPMFAAYNYAQVLQHTTFFYEAQRSGKLP
eukprot:32428_3